MSNTVFSGVWRQLRPNWSMVSLLRSYYTWAYFSRFYTGTNVEIKSTRVFSYECWPYIRFVIAYEFAGNNVPLIEKKEAERHLSRASYTYIWMHTDSHLILILSLTKVYVLTWGVAVLEEKTEQSVERTVQIEQRTEQQISIVERTEHFRAKSSASHCKWVSAMSETSKRTEGLLVLSFPRKHIMYCTPNIKRLLWGVHWLCFAWRSQWHHN